MKFPYNITKTVVPPKWVLYCVQLFVQALGKISVFNSLLKHRYYCKECVLQSFLFNAVNLNFLTKHFVLLVYFFMFLKGT